jgi:hypothetical protein
MARRHQGLPKATARKLSKNYLLELLQKIDNSPQSQQRVLRLEIAFRKKISAHIGSLPPSESIFQKFNTNPYVLLIHAKLKSYTKISDIEQDIVPAKQFSSMETSAGRMVEEIVLPEYGWKTVPSEMHTSKSSLDGEQLSADIYKIATLKSGPRCLNDEMSENFADAILDNFNSWASEAGVSTLDFTYGVLYGTPKQSNKKDWHILRNVRDKGTLKVLIDPKGRWNAKFKKGRISIETTIRIGLDWWEYLGGETCFLEVFTALIRACICPGKIDPRGTSYAISNLAEIVSIDQVSSDYNVSLLQRSQLPWLFLIAQHFCDELTD